ncbi:MAG: DMT family transporter [Bacteroidota bacterium]
MEDRNPGGIVAALGSALFLGVSPVLGKLAITLGMSPLAVVAFRTALAALLLFLIVVLFKRSYLYIFPVGLLGCLMAGFINGAGSLLYYLALSRLPASLGQMLYSLYPVFVAMWLMLDHQPPSRLTILRLLVAAGAVLLLTNFAGERADTLGVIMMLLAALLYALHLPINQRVLYEVPAPTVTLYTLLAMSAVVIPAFLILDRSWPAASVPWAPLLGLGLATFFSRLGLFLGVKRIGGMQTALLGLAELLVTIGLSHFWLHESLTSLQWLGAAALVVSLLLVRLERPVFEKDTKGGWLAWIRPSGFPRDIWPPYE